MLDPPPVEVTQLIERRKRLGLDLYDEIWEGVYHMAPAPRCRHGDLDQQLAEILGPLGRKAGLLAGGPFNLGGPDDFRVPDRGLHRTEPGPDTVYLATAAMVVEIVSPGDETYDKLPFYAAHGVEEVLIVDPSERVVRLMALAGDHYGEAPRSAVLDVEVGQIRDAICWP